MKTRVWITASVLVVAAVAWLGVYGVAQGIAPEKKPAKANPNDEPAQKPVFEGLERKEYEVVFHLVDAKDKPVIADEYAGGVGAMITRSYDDYGWRVPVRVDSNVVSADLVAGQYALDVLAGNYGVVSYEFEVTDKAIEKTLKTPYWRRVVEFKIEDSSGEAIDYVRRVPLFNAAKSQTLPYRSTRSAKPRLALPVYTMAGRGGYGGFAHRRKRPVEPVQAEKTDDGSVWIVVYAGCESKLNWSACFDSDGVKVHHDYDSKFEDVEDAPIDVLFEVPTDARVGPEVEEGCTVINLDDEGWQSRTQKRSPEEFKRAPYVPPVTKDENYFEVKLPRTLDAALWVASTTIGLGFDFKPCIREGDRFWIYDEWRTESSARIHFHSKGRRYRSKLGANMWDLVRYQALEEERDFRAHNVYVFIRPDEHTPKSQTIPGAYFRLLDENLHGVPMAEAILMPLEDKDQALKVQQCLRERRDSEGRVETNYDQRVVLDAVTEESSGATVQEAIDGIQEGLYDALDTREARLYFCKHGTWYDPWTQMRGDTDGYFIAPDQRMERGKKYALYVWTKSTDDLEPDYRFVFEGQGETTDLGCIALKDD